MLYMRCRCEQLLSASCKRLEAARVCAFAARISTFAEHHLEENCSRQLAAARQWPMAWPPFRRSVRTAHGADFRINWPRPCKARARGGTPRSLWRRNSLRKRLRFARNGGHHRKSQRTPNRRKLLKRRGSFAGLYRHFHFMFCVKLHWNPASYDQDSLCEIS